MIDRRGFLATSAAAAATLLAPRRLLAAVERHSSPSPDLSNWQNVRSQFALKPGQLHFSSFYLASHPRPVRDAIDAFRRALDEEPYLTLERVSPLDPGHVEYRVREDLSGYLGAHRDEIALVPNTTTALALVYNGLPLAPGDEILTTTHDHYSHHESIRFAVEKSGARWRRVPLYDRGAEAATDPMVDRLRRAIRPETRAVGVTWVHSSTGVRLPLRALADVVREANRGRDEKDQVLLIVDGVHGLGAVDETVAELGCDFFAAGTHKWMFAPRGTGILWGRAGRWSRLRPTVPSFFSIPAWEAWLRSEPVSHEITSYDVSPGGFCAFEHQWAMSAAFKFHEAIGKSRVAARIRELSDRCKAGLAENRRVVLHTPRSGELSAGLVAFEVEGQSPDAVVARLLERNIVASSSPYHVSYVRLAPSLVNDPAEVDTAVRAVREITGA